MLDWLRYIFYTGADERENLPEKNRMTGSHLRQGGSSWTTPPAAAVPAQRTGTQPDPPQPRSPGPTLLQQPIEEFVEKLERSDVIPANHKCRAEAAQTLSNDGSRSNG